MLNVVVGNRDQFARELVDVRMSLIGQDLHFSNKIMKGNNNSHKRIITMSEKGCPRARANGCEAPRRSALQRV